MEVTYKPDYTIPTDDFPVTPEETTHPSGDNGRFFLWIGLIAVSALSIVILLIRQRRKTSRA